MAGILASPHPEVHRDARQAAEDVPESAGTLAANLMIGCGTEDVPDMTGTLTPL